MAEGDTPHLACPFEDCGSSDAFNWNDNGYGYCHSCGGSYPSSASTFDCAEKEKDQLKTYIAVLDDLIQNGKKYLENNNILCAIHYPKPFYESIAYEHVKVENCEIMENVKDKLLSLPMYPELSGNEVEYVCEKINSFYK